MGSVYEVRIPIIHQILKAGRDLQKAKVWAWGHVQGLGWCNGHEGTARAEVTEDAFCSLTQFQPL